jgi:hypothetical protein
MASAACCQECGVGSELLLYVWLCVWKLFANNGAGWRFKCDVACASLLGRMLRRQDLT